MEQFLRTETLIIGLLLIVSLVAIAIRRLKVPYTVALVVVGLLITSQSGTVFELTPELILALFLPPLVFEAAFHLNLRELQNNMRGILFLAVPGVIISMLIIAGIVMLGTTLTLPIALVFGSLIAATDPVAVVALFRALGVPKRLSVLVEGESLFNDGTAIVLFNLMLAVALTGKFSFTASLGDFLRVSLGGILVGLLLGTVVSRLITHVDDYLIETTLTTVLAYGSYLLGEQLHVSGVLAVVVAGLVNGNIGSQGMSPTTRIVLSNFWEYVAFLVSSLVFLLIGMDINLPALAAAWQPVLWAILAILVARMVVVYGSSLVLRRIGEPIPISWQHVINWGGLRGAICLALALSLPEALGPDRELLRLMTFGVVLFTLLVQSTTMGPLIRRLKIVTRSEAQVEYELRHARLTALRSGDARIDRMHEDGLLSTHTWERLKHYLSENAASLTMAVRELLLTDPALEAEELDTGWRELQRSQRATLLSLRRDGVISEEVFEVLTAEVDAQLSEGVPLIPESGSARTHFIEVTLPPTSQSVGKSIAEINIPRAAVLVSIRRDKEIIIPRGDTMLSEGDVVTLLCEGDSASEARQLLVSSEETV